MPSLTDDDIAEALGTPKPEKPVPASRVEDALAALDAHDAKVSALVEKHRNHAAGETHQAASDRLMRESPALYAADKAQRGAIIRGKGIGNASTGGV